MVDKQLAAAFIDFENFYYSLTNLYETTHKDAGEVVISLIASQLERLRSEKGEFIIRQAFADWSSFQGPKKELQRIGIRVIDVLSTEYKNSADIELSLSVLETVLTREEISTIVIFAGDRDYMPVALRARERGKNLYFVGFEKSLSGDVKSLVGESNYSYVVPEESTQSKNPNGLKDNVDAKEPLLTILGLTSDEAKAAEAAVKAYDQYEVRFGCVKLSVFLAEGLNNALPYLEHFQRKQVFSSLVEKGIVVTQQRTPEYTDTFGNAFPFIVFVINEENQAVKSIRAHTRSTLQNSKDLLLEASRRSADKNGTILGANLGNMLKKLDPSFMPGKYGFNSLTEYIERYPDILIYEGLKSGGDKAYRFIGQKS